MNNGDPTTGFLIIGAIICIYLLPMLVAGSRKHHQRTAITVVNIFLGWTVLGWIGALVWACTYIPPEYRADVAGRMSALQRWEGKGPPPQV